MKDLNHKLTDCYVKYLTLALACNLANVNQTVTLTYGYNTSKTATRIFITNHAL